MATSSAAGVTTTVGGTSTTSAGTTVSSKTTYEPPYNHIGAATIFVLMSFAYGFAINSAVQTLNSEATAGYGITTIVLFTLAYVALLGFLGFSLSNPCGKVERDELMNAQKKTV